jgi:hypothetical protein
MRMPDNKKSPSLKYEQILSKSMDYFFLRKEGIRYAQELSGKIWTDYNDHDPGVTILEQYCFALTDIAFRTNIDIEKILFSEKNRSEVASSNCLYNPEEILLSPHLTIQDNKMLFLDQLKDISNIWFRKTPQCDINGLYDIYAQPALNYTNEEEIEWNIRSFFAKNRNLSEDINNIIILTKEDLEIEVHIDIYEEYNAEEILAEVYFQLDSYFNPQIQYDSLETLINQDLSYEQIFDRPSFDSNKGFINNAYFTEYQTTFSFSKVQTRIVEVKGVRNVQELTVKKNGIKIGGKQITIEDGTFVSLTTILDKPGIIITKNNIRIDYNIAKVKALYYQKMAEITQNHFSGFLPNFKKTSINTQDISQYTSIQNTFPATYGIGNYGLSGDANNKKQYIRQLQSYILFFDQILLNHLAQLKNIPDLFSIDTDQVKKTYFEQVPENIPDID